MPHDVTPSTDAAKLRFAVVTTSWYADVIARLKAAALETLAAAGVADDNVTIVEVPGAYELPQAAGWIARAGDADAIIALGCVVRGETPHFDYVAGACSDGLMQVALETGIPVAMGVITADTHAQAEARSSDTTGKGGNKGIEAADAALRMALLYRGLEDRRTP